MSAYGKPPPSAQQDFDSSRPFAEPAFQYAASPFASESPVSTSNAPSYQNVGQMTQLPYTSSQARPAYDDPAGPYLNVGSTAIPQVTSFAPHRGSAGGVLTVYINSMYDLTPPATPSFTLMFGSKKCPATLSKATQQGAMYQYSVQGAIPMYASTGWDGQPVPIYVLMEGADEELLGRVDVGSFSYLDSMPLASYDSTRKRRISPDSSELRRSPVKRSVTTLARKDDFAPYGYTTAEPYSPYLQSASAYGMVPQYSNRGSVNYSSQTSPRQMNYQYSSSSAASPVIKPSSPGASNSWSPYSVSSHVARSPRIAPSMSDNSRTPLAALPSPQANPPLIRTSTLQQTTPSPATTPAGAHAAFNPYALYPHKAVLKIQGDLNTMAESWSADEWESRRRIVLFKRSQSGSTITTTFRPVSPDERPSDSVCISCIWWEEKGECFVTSVDTIFLLEKLVAARFTVEEKNRIRRNLEGFRPLTVSKGKAESEEFFKVIMAFPNPKPRNIEKDVKVFKWKDLTLALKKIIGKYSASPSSTLPPALLTPVSSTGYSNEHIDNQQQHQRANHSQLSPRSISGGSASTAAYATSTPLSPRSRSHNYSQPAAYSAVPHDSSSQWSTHNLPSTSQYQQTSQRYDLDYMDAGLGSASSMYSRGMNDARPRSEGRLGSVGYGQQTRRS